MLRLLTTLLATFLATSPAAAIDKSYLAAAFTEPVCYSQEQRAKIAAAITDLAKCQADVAAKDELIQKHMLTMDGLNPGPAFWQEPGFVWGGMVVGVATGGIITFLVLRGK